MMLSEIKASRQFSKWEQVLTLSSPIVKRVHHASLLPDHLPIFPRAALVSVVIWDTLGLVSTNILTRSS